MSIRKLYHERIADTLRAEILARAKPGDKLASDAAHARRFDVSVITVREALRLLCQEGLLERRQGSSTRVRAVTPHLRRVAVVAPTGLEAAPYFFHHRVREAAVPLLKAQGLEVEFLPDGSGGARDGAPFTAANRPAHPLRDLRKRTGDRAIHGVLRLLGKDERADVLELEQAGIAVVGQNEHDCTHHVTVDHAGLVRTATRHLLDQGRRRIAFVQYEQPGLKRHGEEWYLLVHFRETLAEAGVRFHREWVCTAHNPLKPGSGWDHIHDIWLGKGPKPDALLVGVDTLFTETAMALLSLGVRVPDKLLVATHANKGSGIFHPFPVVRFEVDPEACGRAMADVLLRRLRGEPRVPQATVVPFRHVQEDDT